MTRYSLFARITGIAFLSLTTYTVAHSAATQQHIIVQDGDSFILNGERWRLWGIDAPELAQTCTDMNTRTEVPCGEQSRAYLQKILTGRTIRCYARDTDNYGRSIGVCAADTIYVNARMVQDGWALEYRRYSQGTFAQEETSARTQRIGIWHYRFMLPEQWRRRNRQTR